jgi:hypothetical protein
MRCTQHRQGNNRAGDGGLTRAYSCVLRRRKRSNNRTHCCVGSGWVCVSVCGRCCTVMRVPAGGLPCCCSYSPRTLTCPRCLLSTARCVSSHPTSHISQASPSLSPSKRQPQPAASEPAACWPSRPKDPRSPDISTITIMYLADLL